jgi:hypothetical protein
VALLRRVLWLTSVWVRWQVRCFNGHILVVVVVLLASSLSRVFVFSIFSMLLMFLTALC